MTIEELKEEKYKLQDDIRELITAFHRKTNKKCIVSDVKIINQVSSVFGKNQKTFSTTPHIDIDLEII